jgi:hypothetical protein
MVTAVTKDATDMATMRTTFTLTPRLQAVSSPESIAFKFQVLRIKSNIHDAVTEANIANSLQLARDKSPKVQKTMDASWVSSAKY